jgi:hypothetical protein
VDKAAAAISDNKSDNQQLTNLPLADIEVGVWDYVNKTLLAWQWPPDPSYWGKYIGPGISVPTKRTESYNTGPVTMTVAKVFKINTVSVYAKATAALSGIGGFTPGSPVMPFGPMNPPPDPGDEFTGWFRNDTNDTMGWSNLQGVPPGESPPSTSANDLKDLLAGNGSPDTTDGKVVISINNGQVAAAIHTMVAKNNLFGLVETEPKSNIYTPLDEPNPSFNDGTTYADTVYMLPVFDKSLVDPDANTEKFNQAGVIGAVPVKLLEVGDSPHNYIKVLIMDGYIAPGLGGGPWYGILSTQPKLVK